MDTYEIATEQQALELLGISDFRHVKKENVLTLVNMLNRMDPELARSITAQIPNLTKMTTEALSEQRKLAETVADKNSEIAIKSLEINETAINAIVEIGKCDTLSDEAKDKLSDKIMKLAENAGEQAKDTTEKNTKLYIGLAATAAVTTLVVGAVFGLKVDVTKIPKLLGSITKK